MEQQRRAGRQPLRPENLTGGRLLRQLSETTHAQLEFLEMLGRAGRK